eukprot:scaffold4412_cov401-Prasinococcus_capsulatus_cf.AAC.7
MAAISSLPTAVVVVRPTRRSGRAVLIRPLSQVLAGPSSKPIQILLQVSQDEQAGAPALCLLCRDSQQAGVALESKPRPLRHPGEVQESLEASAPCEADCGRVWHRCTRPSRKAHQSCAGPAPRCLTVPAPATASAPCCCADRRSLSMPNKAVLEEGPGARHIDTLGTSPGQGRHPDTPRCIIGSLGGLHTMAAGYSLWPP